MSTQNIPLDLKVKYREVLAGFEHLGFTDQQLREVGVDLDLMLKDLEVCKGCQGDICKTDINHHCKNPYWHGHLGNPCGPECYEGPPAYWGLWKSACARYKMPIFAVHQCPGPLQRKEEILAAMQDKSGRNAPWWDK